MSTTDIYRLGRDPGAIGETRNAWRGAMYVWSDIARRYFGLEHFPMGWDEAGKEMQSKIWNAPQHRNVLNHERIVLETTMDNATVVGSDLPAVLAAFDQYAREHPNSSIGEQAEILRTADIQPNDHVAWCQTSVSEFWGSRWDEEKEATVWYDPATGDRHFEIKP